MREKSNFASRINVIWPVQSSREKYCASVFQKYVVSSRHPASTKEGRIAIVTNVERGMRAASGATISQGGRAW